MIGQFSTYSHHLYIINPFHPEDLLRSHRTGDSGVVADLIVPGVGGIHFGGCKGADDDADDDQQRAEQRDAAEHSADDGDEEQPAVAPEDFVPDVAVVKRDDGRPSGLTGLLEDFPAGHNVENEECQDDEPKSSKDAEKCVEGRRL